MPLFSPNETGRNPQAARTVVVFFEDAAAREQALSFCDHLVTQWQLNDELKVHWWPCHLLDQSSTGGEAIEKAVAAHLVVFAMNSAGDLPHEIKDWIENWLGKRGEREGALVGLFPHEAPPGDIASFREIYLRNVALRAGMDYLSHVPPTLPKALPESPDSYTDRAGQMTSVMDGILRTHPPAPRL